ncbi:hypothetical protein SEA_OGOPOGO_98 [Mycobacterium phage Ogopogo]|nr:hypothetical protein SEA_OGOPOGO_98 [Mycobacterium phage Ogopogo]
MTKPIDTDAHAETPTKPEHMNPEHARLDFYHLALDYVYIKTTLENPPKQHTARRTSTRIEYGHPAEWASDTAALIADIMTSWHELVAEDRNETPPNTTTAETQRVVNAWKYLEPRMEHLCNLVTKEDLKEVNDLHHTIRRTLRMDRQPAIWLSIECPVCDHRAVFQDMQRERLNCGNCGWSDTEARKDFHVFRTLVDVVERYTPFLP